MRNRRFKQSDWNKLSKDDVVRQLMLEIETSDRYATQLQEYKEKYGELQQIPRKIQ